MLYYLGGPMTGLSEYNFPAFDRAAAELRDLGYEVVSAHEVDYNEDEMTRGSKPYLDYVKGDLVAMLGCDAVIFLPGYKRSRGCMIELHLARLIEMEVYTFVHRNPPRKSLIKREL